METFNFWILLTVLYKSIILGSGLPCPSTVCSCREGDSIVCSGKRLERIPSFTSTEPTTFNRVDLSQNDIYIVAHYAFSNLKAKQIDLSGNNLVGISPRAFNGIEDYLEVLDLHNSQISVIHWAVFNKLVKLKSLNLSSNRIFTIQEELLQELVELRYLDLSWNKLTRLNDFCFSELEKLETLNLQGNAISSIEAGSFAKQLHLSNLNLRSNRINHLIPNTFARLESVIELDIGDNSLTTIDPDLFKSLSTLQELHLDQNNITELAQSTFLANHQLTTLLLGLNNLVNVSYNVFAPVPLKNLDLSSNNIHFFDGGHGCMENIKNLLMLKLNNNPLNCGCHMAWISDVIQQKAEVTGVCDAPAKFSKMPLSMVDFKQCKRSKPCSGKANLAPTTPGFV